MSQPATPPPAPEPNVGCLCPPGQCEHPAQGNPIYSRDLRAEVATIRQRELDNHHNALKCPYCNPKAVDPEVLLAEVATLRQRSIFDAANRQLDMEVQAVFLARAEAAEARLAAQAEALETLEQEIRRVSADHTVGLGQQLRWADVLAALRTNVQA